MINTDHRQLRFSVQTRLFLVALVAVVSLLVYSSASLRAEPGELSAAELEGFFELDPTQFNLQPSANPTDALWQLFRSVDISSVNSINIQTREKTGFAVVDIKLDGVSDPGIRAVFYRGIAERGLRGWEITRMGRQHRCSRFGMGVLPTWTRQPCL